MSTPHVLKCHNCSHPGHYPSEVNYSETSRASELTCVDEEVCAVRVATRQLEKLGIPEEMRSLAKPQSQLLPRNAMRCERVHPKAVLPSYGSEGAGAVDFFFPEGVTFYPGVTKKVALGVKVQLPEGTVGLFNPRGSANHVGLVIQGVVDDDFRGEVFLIVHNVDSVARHLEPGTRAGQMVIVPKFRATIVEAPVVADTKRGEGCLGSTGA